MKVNNAPEKIHIQPNAHDRWFEGNRPNGLFVEYIRADASIEKACDAYCKVCDTKECEGIGECDWVKRFRKHLKK